jgi:UDP-N-acetylmuramoylalanine--D-glutamate ligase
MMLDQLQNQTVGIIGVGQEGQAIARYLVLHGIKPIMFDQKPESEWSEGVLGFIHEQGLKIVAGPGSMEELNQAQVIFRSPGYWRKNPDLLQAEQAGANITSQTKWFFEHCPAKIIGVTGTKGKGTTSSLIFEILTAAKSAGYINGNIYLTGNIGKQQPLEFLDSLSEGDFIVYEMSSFQLQDLTISPHIGVCLMVTSDHLDHHEDLAEYHSAKNAITAFQTRDDIAIYNADYTASLKIGQLGQGHKLSFSQQTPQASGATIEDEIIKIKTPVAQMLLNCEGRLLRGKHNLQNIAAASLVAVSLGIEQLIIESAIKTFKGLEHRLQFVATKRGVSYFNDSISTVPDTAIAAVKAFNEPVIIIVGGSDKGVSFDELATFLNQTNNLKAVVLAGAVGPKIKELLTRAGMQKPVTGPFYSMEEIVESAASLAVAGDVVVLSPATASFDMFKNYEDRGRKFVERVEVLP